MTRKKVKLAFISNDASRKATFKKRKKGLMKKVGELSTLCGIDACAIIYSQYEPQPEVWPNTVGVQRVLAQFKRMPEMEQSKKMVNQESFIRQRIAKANEQLKKQHKDNREKEMIEVMYQCLTGKIGLQNLMIPDLNDLGWLIDQKLKEIYKRIDQISATKKKNTTAQIINQVAPAAGGKVGMQPFNILSNDSYSSSVTGSGSGSGSAAAMLKGKGVANCADGTEENAIERDMEAMQQQQQQQQRPPWFIDWINSNNGNSSTDQMQNQQQHCQNLGFSRGEEMMMPYGDAQNGGMWSSAFFP
ncbi:agamous-like MADS-box protein AGL80 [Apium graveolens]|uniref:agamous-like MADS-box protein AGL80 n=1 Tax=Apium graveolens TaxID=4045 RepID=UPI003D7C0C7B